MHEHCGVMVHERGGVILCEQDQAALTLTQWKHLCWLFLAQYSSSWRHHRRRRYFWDESADWAQAR